MSDEALYAVVSQFGHRVFAGRVFKVADPFPMLRIDIPATSHQSGFSRELGPASIFDITYVSEEVAQRVAEELNIKPVEVYAPDLVTRQELDAVTRKYETLLNQRRALSEGDRRPLEQEGFSEEDERVEEQMIRAERDEFDEDEDDG